MRHIPGRWKNGDWSNDGTKRFWAYGPIRKDGTRGERWMTPEQWDRHHAASARATIRHNHQESLNRVQLRILDRTETRAGKGGHKGLKPGFIAEVQRHLSRGRDLGRIVTFMGIPASKVQAAIDHINAQGTLHVHLPANGAERSVSPAPRQNKQARGRDRVHQPGAHACAHSAQG